MAAKATRSLPLTETLDEAKLHVWVQLTRSFLLVQRRIATTLAAQDVTLPQFDVLATLRYGEALTQQELAQRLLVTKGNVCGVLDRLEKLGWVDRRPDPQDGRANRLYLTPAGRRKAETLLPEHNRIVLHAMNALTGADVKGLIRVLAELEAAIDDD